MNDDKKMTEETTDKKYNAVRFNGIYNRFAAIEKRIKSLRSALFGISIFLLAAFSIMFYFIHRNFSNEKKDLRAFIQAVKEEANLLSPRPELEILGSNGLPFEGQKISVKPSINDGKIQIEIPHTVKNIGKSSSGPLHLKYYANNPIVLSDKSQDDPQFKFEAVISPKNFSNLDNLPGGGFSVVYTSRLTIKGVNSGIENISGEHPMLMKYFYGNSSVKSAKFTLLIDKKW